MNKLIYIEYVDGYVVHVQKVSSSKLHGYTDDFVKSFSEGELRVYCPHIWIPHSCHWSSMKKKVRKFIKELRKFHRYESDIDFSYSNKSNSEEYVREVEEVEEYYVQNI